jgi:hypothetical protein
MPTTLPLAPTRFSDLPTALLPIAMKNFKEKLKLSLQKVVHKKTL